MMNDAQISYSLLLSWHDWLIAYTCLLSFLPLTFLVPYTTILSFIRYGQSEADRPSVPQPDVRFSRIVGFYNVKWREL